MTTPSNEMKFEIRPKNPLEIFFRGKRVGNLDNVTHDFNEQISLMVFKIPFKISLALSIHEDAFENKAVCNKLVNLLSKSKSIFVTIY